MRPSVPKKRKAWLITWESSRQDYLADLNRPRIVAILNPRYSSRTIKTVLPVLFISESQLTFGEKRSGISFGKQRRNWIRDESESICCGDNPWLRPELSKTCMCRVMTTRSGVRHFIGLSLRDIKRIQKRSRRPLHTLNVNAPKTLILICSGTAGPFLEEDRKCLAAPSRGRLLA